MTRDSLGRSLLLKCYDGVRERKNNIFSESTYSLRAVFVVKLLADELVRPFFGLVASLAGDSGYNERHVGG